MLKVSAISISFLGIVFIITSYFLLYPKDNHFYETCMGTKPGITLSELEELFGKANEVKTEGGNSQYLFGSHKYSVLHSDYIRATQDNDSKKIVSLSCGEYSIVWDDHD